MKNDEHLVQKAICEYLDIRRVCYFAIPNGGKRGKIEASKFRAEGVKSGVPDLFFVWEGMSYFLEVKRPKNGIIPRGRVSKNQTEMMDKLTDNGAECAVVYCVADVIEKFIDWGIGH
tara:strand:- start:2 stop:352 length:351 start_codon:yes stop_codon:yes gene_type:complete